MNIAALALASTLVLTPQAASPTENSAQPSQEVVSSMSIVSSQDSELVWQGKIFAGINGDKIQYVMLKNAVMARLSYNEKTGIFRAVLTDGSKLDIDLTDSMASSATPGIQTSTRQLKKPNQCQVASGIAGLAHSALWGAAVGAVYGNLPGVAVGTAVGAFWWAIGTQC